MKSSYSELRDRMIRCARVFVIPVLTVAFVLCGMSAAADAATGAGPQAVEGYHFIQMKGLVASSEATEIVTALRNVLPRSRIFFVYSRDAIAMVSTEHDFEIAQKLVADMSQGPRVFRLTYTFTHPGGGKDGAGRSLSVVVGSGESGTVKQGERVPLVVGSDKADGKVGSEDYQYIDVGLNLNASLRGPADDLVLRTQIAESAVVPDKSVAGLPDPVIRQMVLNNTSIVTVGRPLLLGSMEVPGSSRHEQIEVTVEPVQ